MHALFVYFNWENFLRNFWEVCTFRLVRIFTPEDMFASGKEIGKGCGDVHSISDFLFDFEPHKVSHIRSRSSSLNWTTYSWEIISWKALKKKNFKITEKYAYLMITCAIKTNYDNLCDQNELRILLLLHNYLFVLTFMRKIEAHVYVIKDVTSNRLKLHPRSTSNEFREGQH